MASKVIPGETAVGVQPMLQAIDVTIGGGLSGSTASIREVRVESVRSRLRLTHNGGRDRQDDQPKRSRKAQIHECDREAAG